MVHGCIFTDVARTGHVHADMCAHALPSCVKPIRTCVRVSKRPSEISSNCIILFSSINFVPDGRMEAYRIHPLAVLPTLQT